MMRKIHTRRLNRSLAGNIGINTILLIFGVFMAAPLVYAVCTSVKPFDELWVFPPRFFVRNPTFKNFVDLAGYLSSSRVPFSRYLFNTVFVSFVGTAGHVILSSLCAYALSKHRFTGQKVLFNLVVVSLMFSAAVTAIPNFIIMSRLHLIDTHWALILPAFSSPLGLYLMKQFIEQMVPDTVLEAARIDGAGEVRIFAQIVMPMVKPAWLTLIVLSFQGLWNMGPTTYIYKEQLKTINYALSQILAGGVARTGAAAAGSVAMMLVPILLFVLTQKNIVETFATSGMKE